MTTTKIPVERDEVLEAIQRQGKAFAELVGSLGGDATTILRDSEWTAADAAAHVVTVLRRALGDLRRSSSPADTARLNAVCLAELDERDPVKLAALLEADVAAAVEKPLRDLPESLEFPFHGGMTTTIVPACCVVLGELVVHGYDIAVATGRDWPIDARDATLVLTAAATLIGGWLRPGPHEPETFELRPAGQPHPIVLAVGDDGVRASWAPVEGATVVEADAVELLLAFPFRRVPAAAPDLARLVAHFEPV